MVKGWKGNGWVGLGVGGVDGLEAKGNGVERMARRIASHGKELARNAECRSRGENECKA